MFEIWTTKLRLNGNACLVSAKRTFFSQPFNNLSTSLSLGNRMEPSIGRKSLSKLGGAEIALSPSAAFANGIQFGNKLPKDPGSTVVPINANTLPKKFLLNVLVA